MDVYPLDIWFPFKPDKLNKCAVTLTNKTDDDLIGVLVATDQPRCMFQPWLSICVGAARLYRGQP